MKKILILILSAIIMCLILSFTGCSKVKAIDTNINIEQATESKFTIVNNSSTILENNGLIQFITMYDNDTKVMYLVTYSYKAGATVIPLLDKEGKPLIYKG